MLKSIPRGTAFGIITPSLSLDSPEQIRGGLAYLNQLGYETLIGNHVYDNRQPSPQERAADIMEFFKNPKVKAIIASRGGWGAQAVLPYLDFEVIRQNPKPIIGFSDITALQNAVYTLSEVPSLAGIMLKYDFDNDNIHPQTRKSFEACLDGEFKPAFQATVLNSGNTEGTLIGGNLCTLICLCGTKYFPSLRDKILLLEDFDEKAYRIERMLTQLEQQPDFELISGIIFGSFNECNPNYQSDKDVETILNDFASRHPKIPMIKHFPHGHTRARLCVPLGTKIKLRISSSETTLEIGN